VKLNLAFHYNIVKLGKGSFDKKKLRIFSTGTNFPHFLNFLIFYMT